jgi:hypothetical protein
MPKIKAYTTSVGDSNSYILLEADDVVAYGYTKEVPPLPTKGRRVVWDEKMKGWKQVEVSVLETVE